MFQRFLASVLTVVLATIALAQNSPTGGRLVLSPDAKRAILITQPLVLIDNYGQFLDLIVTGRYLNKRPQRVPERLELTFFSRSAEPLFRRSHQLSIVADGDLIELGRTSYAEFSAVEADGKRIAVANLDPAEKIEPFAPSNSRLMATDPKRTLVGELMVRDGLTLDQWIRLSSAARLELRLGPKTLILDAEQRQLLRDFSAKITPSAYRPRDEKIDSSLTRRQVEAPSAANQASLESTLKWLKRESGTSDGNSREASGPYTYGVDFSSCDLTYRIEQLGRFARDRRRLPLLDAMYEAPFTIVTVNLADLDPDLLVFSSSDLGENVDFQTLGGAEKIQLEFRGGLTLPMPTQRPGSKKLKANHRFEIRDRRLGQQFVEAFAHAIALCQQKP